MLSALLPVVLLLVQPVPTVASEQPPTPTPVLDELREEASALKPLVVSEFATAFLDATQHLPEPRETIVYRAKDGRTISAAQYEALGPEAQEAFTRRVLPPRFFYTTAFGTPLLYTRALDLLASRDDAWTPEKAAGTRVLDFGCGTIGHLRLLAALGVEATGVDVEPLFGALYAQPGDQGPVQTPGGPRGFARVLIGRWPAQESIVADVKANGPYDLFISKNTLKRGYIHPARPTDPNRLVHLGVEDGPFLKAVHDALKPGGVFLIYNICPAQAPEDKPYLPHADGTCPFDRAELETAGFEVLVYDETDHEKIVDYWHALGLNQGKTREETQQDLFAWWTMCRRRG